MIADTSRIAPGSKDSINPKARIIAGIKAIISK
jgi:hypothetical protein